MLKLTGLDVVFAAAGNLYLLLALAGVCLALWNGTTWPRSGNAGTTSTKVTDSDVVYAGSGNDKVYGGLGNDLLLLEGGNNFAVGYIGSDDIQGGAGADVIYGDGGSDTILGGAGNDILVGDAGVALRAGTHHESNYLDGEEGNDILYGGTGDEVVHRNCHRYKKHSFIRPKYAGCRHIVSIKKHFKALQTS